MKDVKSHITKIPALQAAITDQESFTILAYYFDKKSSFFISHVRKRLCASVPAGTNMCPVKMWPANNTISEVIITS